MSRIKTKEELQFYILADRLISGLPAKPSIRELVINFIFAIFGFHQISEYLYAMRCYSYYKGKKGLLNKCRKFWYSIKFNSLGQRMGFSIGEDTFGWGLLIPHYGTIVINGNTIAGNLCCLHTSTCIGGNNKKIGDALYLSTGAKIVKPLTLGDNVTIAAQSLVNRTFGSNLLLKGAPASIKRNDNIPWYEMDDIYSARAKKIIELSTALDNEEHR